MDNLERIANNGVYFKSEGNRKGRDQIGGIDHLMTTVYIDGVPTLVDMRVRLVQQERNSDTDNVLYYFTPETIKLKQEDGAASAAERQAFRGEASPSSNIIVPQRKSEVNGQSAPNSDGVFLPGETLSAEDLQKELKAVWKQRALEELNAAYEKNVGAVEDDSKLDELVLIEYDKRKDIFEEASAFEEAFCLHWKGLSQYLF